MDADGKKIKGELKSVDGNDFVVTVREKVKVEGKKRPYCRMWTILIKRIM